MFYSRTACVWPARPLSMPANKLIGPAPGAYSPECVEVLRLLKTSLGARFRPRSGTKQTASGAFQAQFLVVISSTSTFSSVHHGPCRATRTLSRASCTAASSNPTMKKSGRSGAHANPSAPHLRSPAWQLSCRALPSLVPIAVSLTTYVSLPDICGSI